MGCETEENKLQIFQSKVIRKTFWTKGDEVCRKWSILHNEKLCELYRSPSIVKVMKLRMLWWSWHIA